MDGAVVERKLFVLFCDNSFVYSHVFLLYFLNFLFPLILQIWNAAKTGHRGRQLQDGIYIEGVSGTHASHVSVHCQEALR